MKDNTIYYYSDTEYGDIPIPSHLEEYYPHLKYDGTELTVDENAIWEDAREHIFIEMDKVYTKLSRNYLRPSYRNSPDYDKYKLKYEQELLALEKKLEEI